MDSKLVIEQMAGRWRIKHPGLKPLAIQANSLAPVGPSWTWIPREHNREADRLANEALDRAVRPTGGERAGASSPLPRPESLNTLPGWDAELGEPTTLILLRHGTTPHTLAKRFSGSGGDDPGLNDAGRGPGPGGGRLAARRGPHRRGHLVTAAPDAGDGVDRGRLTRSRCRARRRHRGGRLRRVGRPHLR